MVRLTGENYRGLSGRILHGPLFRGRCPGLRDDGPLGLLSEFRAFLGCLGSLLACVISAHAADAPHAGPLLERFDLTLSPGHRSEGFGPLSYHELKDTQETYAVPPFFSHVEDPATDSEEFDFAYPLLTYDRFGGQYRWQFCQLLSIAGGPSPTESQRDRFTFFPIFFHQRSSDTNEGYTAVLPIYGHVNNRLFRDDVWFYSPFYIVSRKKDVITENYFYPFFHRRHGDGLRGWQFWPFVGHEHKDVTTRINGFHDLETVPGHDETFVLWPFYGDARTGLGTENPGHERLYLPFYDGFRSPQRDSTIVLWPCFTWIDDREKKYREWEGPWPVVVIARGEGKTTTRFVPFFSRSHNAYLESDSYAWPIYIYQRTHSDPLDTHRTRILFFLFSDRVEKNTETGASRRRTDLLPFFTHQRDFNGNTRLQILALLEPLLPASKSIERNYSPLWSLWRAERNAQTGATSQSLLWNLYRRETVPASTQWSALFGLFQSRSGREGKQVKVFYIPFGNRNGESEVMPQKL